MQFSDRFSCCATELLCFSANDSVIKSATAKGWDYLFGGQMLIICCFIRTYNKWLWAGECFKWLHFLTHEKCNEKWISSTNPMAHWFYFNTSRKSKKSDRRKHKQSPAENEHENNGTLAFSGSKMPPHSEHFWLFSCSSTIFTCHAVAFGIYFNFMKHEICFCAKRHDFELVLIFRVFDCCSQCTTQIVLYCWFEC